jgi:hypothetical protein
MATKLADFKRSLPALAKASASLNLVKFASVTRAVDRRSLWRSAHGAIGHQTPPQASYLIFQGHALPDQLMMATPMPWGWPLESSGVTYAILPANSDARYDWRFLV